LRLYELANPSAASAAELLAHELAAPLPVNEAGLQPMASPAHFGLAYRAWGCSPPSHPPHPPCVAVVFKFNPHENALRLPGLTWEDMADWREGRVIGWHLGPQAGPTDFARAA
jgi:hypothetical protein